MDKFSDYWGYVLVACLAVTFLGQASKFPSRASLYQPIAEGDLAVELTVHQRVPLNSDVIRRDWVNFSESDYFGAFAYNAAEQTYDYYVGVSSIEHAKTAALTFCGRESRTPSNCKIYAELSPKVPSKVLPRRMAKTAEIDFIDSYLKGAERWKYGAFAINGHGDYGWATGYDTLAEARFSATRYCDTVAVESKAKVAEYNVPGLVRSTPWKCAVIHDN